MSSIHDVSNFHKKFDIKPLQDPGFLSIKETIERLNFILEEVNELAVACGINPIVEHYSTVDMEGSVDLEQSLDALVDICYVTLGTANLMGFKNPVPVDSMGKWASIWHEAWSRVHEANMAKVRVITTKESKRGMANDLKKPANWKAPTFKDILPKETNATK